MEKKIRISINSRCVETLRHGGGEEAAVKMSDSKFTTMELPTMELVANETDPYIQNILIFIDKKPILEASMITRFMTFVDGSNLFGALKDIGVQVSNYDGLYRFIFHKALEIWRSRINSSCVSQVPAQHTRVYWYVTSDMDSWDLTNDNTQRMLRDRFDGDTEVKSRWNDVALRRYRSIAHEQEMRPNARTNTNPTLQMLSKDLFGGTRSWMDLNWQERYAIESEAWELCFADLRAWYENKQQTLAGMNRFYHAVGARNDFIEIRRCGRWKVDFLHKGVVEKGLDTSLAVDMIGLLNNYEVAILITGDADGIPSVSYAKNNGKQVGVIEFLRGSSQDSPSRSSASRLKVVADFVVPVYEHELLELALARNGGEPF